VKIDIGILLKSVGKFQFRLKSGKESSAVIYNKPTRWSSDSIVFINKYKYALHVSGAICAHRQEHYKL